MDKNEMINWLFAIVGGSSGAGVIIATMMSGVKAIWKPKNAKLYWAPAGLLSVVATVGLMWYIDMAIWTLGGVATLVVISAYTALYQLMANNEAWSENIKPVIIKILQKLVSRK